MDECSYGKREAYCTDKNINYETLSRIIGHIDLVFNELDIVAYAKSWLKKVIIYIANEIKGLKSLIE